MSWLELSCVRCGFHAPIEAAMAGQTVLCPTCGESIVVPAAPLMPAPPAMPWPPGDAPSAPPLPGAELAPPPMAAASDETPPLAPAVSAAVETLPFQAPPFQAPPPDLVQHPAMPAAPLASDPAPIAPPPTTAQSSAAPVSTATVGDVYDRRARMRFAKNLAAFLAGAVVLVISMALLLRMNR